MADIPYSDAAMHVPTIKTCNDCEFAVACRYAEDKKQACSQMYGKEISPRTVKAIITASPAIWRRARAEYEEELKAKTVATGNATAGNAAPVNPDGSIKVTMKFFRADTVTPPEWEALMLLCPNVAGKYDKYLGYFRGGKYYLGDPRDDSPFEATLTPHFWIQLNSYL